MLFFILDLSPDETTNVPNLIVFLEKAKELRTSCVKTQKLSKVPHNTKKDTWREMESWRGRGTGEIGVFG